MEADARQGRAARIGLAVAAVFVVAEHLRTLGECLNPRYGGGAEYIEHLRRARTWRIVRDGEGWTALVNHLDRSEYPPGLMLAQLPFDLVTGPTLPTAVVTQLAWLALLVGATIACARALGLGPSAPWAGTLVLLAPGAWSTARLFYYDLPCAAALAVALAAWLHGVRKPGLAPFLVATIAVLGAELFRGEAVLAAAPLAAAAGAAALASEGSRATRARALGLIAGSCGAAAAAAWLYIRTFPVSAGMRIGQLRDVNELDGHIGGEGVAGAFAGRLGTLHEDALRFYPTTLAEAIWGASLTLGAAVAIGMLVTRRPLPRPVLALTAGGMIGVPAALLAVTDILESRFLLPMLPVLAVGTAAGLLQLPGKARTGALIGVSTLAAVQLLAFDLTSITSPRGLVPSASYGSIRSDRPMDRECTDLGAARAALREMPADAATFLLDPANMSLGQTPHVWDYAVLLERRPVRRVDQPPVDIRVLDDDTDEPGRRVPYVRHEDPDRPGVLTLVAVP